MRTLEFSVSGQRLKKTPGYSFNHIIMGSKNYLKAHFSFSTSDWYSTKRVAVFKTERETQYVALRNDECSIPNSITESKLFTVQVIGVKGDLRIPTNEITVRQEAS